MRQMHLKVRGGGPRGPASHWPVMPWPPMTAILLLSTLLPAAPARAPARVDGEVDSSKYSPDCGVNVERQGDLLNVSWPMAPGESGQLILNLSGAAPLIERLAIGDATGSVRPLLERLDPVFFLTVGNRRTPPAKPPEQSWRVFFDSPAKRPHQTHRSVWKREGVRVESRGRRATVSLAGLDIGPFAGELQLTFYAGARLVHVEAVVSTQEDRRAIFYDAGLLGEDAGWRHFAWIDTEGKTRRSAAEPGTADRSLKVRHRTLAVETRYGAVTIFPPPHQFFFPRDWSDNLRYVWFGREHRGLVDRTGFGVRQSKSGGGGYVPWFNAPPGSRHRLGVFFLLTKGDADDALKETLRYTHGDRFPELPGYLTMTSHVHMAITVESMKMKERARSGASLPIPEFVGIFKEMGVDMVHLGEFHGDGHQKDPGPKRLPELQAMFDECRRLSNGEFLVIPGEEVNTFLGIRQPRKHPGHWMSLFPGPVYWVMKRGPDQPFVSTHDRYGKIYRVGSREDVVRLLRAEGGLVWAAHPRIKASSWTPDIFRHEDFYLADFWLGGAWKAMPGDLSHEKLGQVTLDLLSDMANWGQKKYMPGEIDVFKIDHTHELYGHMNINYVKLDRLPRYDEGWQSVLDVLRTGKFFVTTGEVLLKKFLVGGMESGETVRLSGKGELDIRVEMGWTFPLRFAELVSGDGERVHRERIDLADTGAFGDRTLKLRRDLRGRRWVRFEVWDVAANGAFTQPVWLENE